MVIRKPNNKHIEEAIKLLENPVGGIVKEIERKKTIQSKYNGYIASFGGSIINSGLIATLMIFEANTEKNKIIEILFNLYNNHFKPGIQKSSGTHYFNQVLSLDYNDQKLLRNNLADLAVEIKLAMRCYQQIENKD